MAMEPGALVTSSLRLVRELGQGGMGSVWVAEHLGLSTNVAVKFVSAEHAADKSMAARFTREASLAAKLKHPHVVQIFDHGVSRDGSLYIAMELLEGESLRDRLERAGRLGVAEVSHVLDQTCKALGKAHSLGLVHRDIKPDNIFLVDVDGEPFVKVLDFGIAREAGGKGPTATVSGTVLGTPYYMSPEQAMSAKHVDQRADLWSLAVVAYQCLTGRVPFDGDTMPAVFVAIANGSFTPPSQLVAEMPAGLDAWFGRAFARDVEARFSSARELADSFEAVADGSALESTARGAAALTPQSHGAGQAPAAAESQSSGEAPATLLGATVGQPASTARPRNTMTIGIAVVAAIALVGLLAVAQRALRPSSVAAPVADPEAASASASAAVPRASSELGTRAVDAAASSSARALESLPVPAVARPSAATPTRGARGTGGRAGDPVEPGQGAPEPRAPASSSARGKLPELGL
jgi:serine/threonine-protein kinase